MQTKRAQAQETQTQSCWMLQRMQRHRGMRSQRRGRRCRRRRGARGNTLRVITQTHRTKKTRHALHARHRIAACNAGSMRANPCLIPPQPALQRSGWDARASGPVMVLGVAKAHANKIRASGHRTPSSDCSTPNAPGRGPGRTRSHFHYTLWKARVFWWNSNSTFDKKKETNKKVFVRYRLNTVD